MFVKVFLFILQILGWLTKVSEGQSSTSFQNVSSTELPTPSIRITNSSEETLPFGINEGLIGATFSVMVGATVMIHATYEVENAGSLNLSTSWSFNGHLIQDTTPLFIWSIGGVPYRIFVFDLGNISGFIHRALNVSNEIFELNQLPLQINSTIKFMVTLGLGDAFSEIATSRLNVLSQPPPTTPPDIITSTTTTTTTTTITKTKTSTTPSQENITTINSPTPLPETTTAAYTPNNGELRQAKDGLLEIFYENRWGHICDDFWSMSATEVACRQLGYRRAKSYSYGILLKTNDYHFDNVICIGNESSLLECDMHLGHDCSSNEHVIIRCRKDGCESYAAFADSKPTLIEYYSESNWFYLCSDNFTQENADVVCRENTQTTAEYYSSEVKNGSIAREIFPYQFRCIGNEDSLCACSKYEQTCSINSTVKVKCRTDEGKLTLMTGTNTHNGFVLINHLGAWKGICLDEKANNNFLTAYVACKQLGYKGLYNFYYGPSVSSVIYRATYFVETPKSFASWISNPICTGSELNISECRISWEHSNCNRNPLWVDCEPYNTNDVILKSNSSRFEGVPNIFWNNNWYKICVVNNAIDVKILGAICRSIGAHSYQSYNTIPKTGNLFITPGYVCFDGEVNLQSCYTDRVNATKCEDGDEAYIRCNHPLDETPSLRYGSSENGIVDIYNSNSWGFACIDGQAFSKSEVRVMCNQLGLHGGHWDTIDNATDLLYPYWNSSFNCSGNETGLSEGNCLEISGIQPKSQCSFPFNPLKVYCTPSSNTMRLLPSMVNNGSYKVEVLSPERIWAPICVITQINYDSGICRLFGFGSFTQGYFSAENANIFADLACTSKYDSFKQCQVGFTYDYISISGCRLSLEVSCDDLQAPRFPVVNLNGTSTGPYSVLLRWEYSHSISEEYMNFSYHLNIVSNNIQTKRQIQLDNIDQSIKSRYYSVRNLRPYVEYSFSVLLRNSVGFGPQGESIDVRTTAPSPLPPASDPNLSDKSNDSLTIEWEAYIISVLHYVICVESSRDNTCVESYLPSSTFILIQDLEPDTEYFVTIIAVTEVGQSPPSEPLGFKTAKENILPIITSPHLNLKLRITDLITRENYSLSLQCEATGIPRPTITWTSNVNDDLTSGNLLALEPGDLLRIGLTNPIIFICTAKSRAGLDSKTVEILIKIDVSGYIDNILFITDDIATELTNIITINTNGVNTSSDNATSTQKEVNGNADDFESLVTKYISNNTLSENRTGVVERMFITAETIIEKDSQLRGRDEIMDETEEIPNKVITVSRAFQNTLNSIENIASKAAVDLQNTSILVYGANSNITVIAQKVNLPKNMSHENLIIPEEKKGEESGFKERIEIPSENLKLLSSNEDDLRIATTVVNTIKNRGITATNDSPRIVSRIVSLVVPSKGERNRRISLTQLVKFKFPIFGDDSNNLTQICSFLDDSYWSREGLRTDEMENVTDCNTNHLTSFAVFVTPRKLGGNDDLRRVASIVSYAVVSISFILLIVSLVLFILSGKNFFKVEANIVYFNYCLSLTLAFGLFLFGIETGTFNGIVCKVIAFLLHYLWLSVFVWTLCNGILILYKLTLGVLNQHKIYPYLIIFGWSFPIINPIITVAIKHGKYVRADEHCFLTHEDGIIWAFIGPILGILSVNMVILIIAVIRISTAKFGSEKLKEKQVLKTALLSTLILTPLLGVPWIILLLNLFIVNPIVQWSFIITNGLMGVFFFFAITMRNAEVKNLLKMKKKDYSQLQVSTATESKSSRMLSEKFKRSVSREAKESVSPTHTDSSYKGGYMTLERMGGSSVQDDDRDVKSPTASISSWYSDPPRPKHLPKPKRSKGSVDSSKDEPRYDVSLNLKPDQSHIYDVLEPKDIKDSKSEQASPVYEEIPENSIKDYENLSDTINFEPNTGNKL